MKDEEKQKQVEQLTTRFKKLCHDEIEKIEDELPKIKDLLLKDKLLKEIDALEKIADEANERAVEMIEKYYQGEEEWLSLYFGS